MVYCPRDSLLLYGAVRNRMRITQQYTPPTVNLGHASSAAGANNANAYLVFPELTIPGRETPMSDRAWYALFAETPHGTECNEMSAQLAVEAMYRHLIEGKSKRPSQRYTLESAMCHANSTLLHAAQQEPTNTYFHTSALSACISHNRFYFTYVGNVHAYLFRNRVVYHLTHTTPANYQSTAACAHRMTREIRPTIDERAQHLGTDSIPMVKHISFNVVNAITHTVTPFNRKVMDYLLLRPDDLIVLCSSSVTKALDPLQLEEIATALPTQLAADEILKMATRQQPAQNHTAVVLRQNPVLKMDDYALTHRHQRDLAIA